VQRNRPTSKQSSSTVLSSKCGASTIKILFASRPRPAHGAGGGPGRPRDLRPLGFRPSAPVPCISGWGVVGGLVCGMWGRGAENSRYGPCYDYKNARHHTGYYDGHLVAAVMYNKHASMPAVDLEAFFSTGSAARPTRGGCGYSMTGRRQLAAENPTAGQDPPSTHTPTCSPSNVSESNDMASPSSSTTSSVKPRSAVSTSTGRCITLSSSRPLQAYGICLYPAWVPTPKYPPPPPPAVAINCDNML
jgi:hypothetical protein